MRGKRIWSWAVPVAASAVLAACGYTAAPSPSNSAAATANPSPTVSSSATPTADINPGDTLRRQLEMVTGTTPPPILIIDDNDPTVVTCDASKGLTASSKSPEYPQWCPTAKQVVITAAFMDKMMTMSPIAIAYELGRAAATAKLIKQTQLFDDPTEVACASGWLLVKLGLADDASLTSLHAYVLRFIKAHPDVYSDGELFWQMGPTLGIALARESKPIEVCSTVS